jgi:hypothetical protein
LLPDVIDHGIVTRLIDRAQSPCRTARCALNIADRQAAGAQGDNHVVKGFKRRWLANNLGLEGVPRSLEASIRIGAISSSPRTPASSSLDQLIRQPVPTSGESSLTRTNPDRQRAAPTLRCARLRARCAHADGSRPSFISILPCVSSVGMTLQFGHAYADPPTDPGESRGAAIWSTVSADDGFCDREVKLQASARFDDGSFRHFHERQSAAPRWRLQVGWGGRPESRWRRSRDQHGHGLLGRLSTAWCWLFGMLFRRRQTPPPWCCSRVRLGWRGDGRRV